MNDPSQSRPEAPIGSLVIIVLMYVPWLFHFFGPQATPSDDDGLEFPFSIFVALFTLVYPVLAIALPIRLYRHRATSLAHGIAFYASLAILVLFGVLFLRAVFVGGLAAVGSAFCFGH